MSKDDSRFQGGRGAVPVGYVTQGRSAVTGPLPLGDTQMQPIWYDAPQYASYNKVPTNYVISTILGGADEATVKGDVQLRPEPFLLQRITWATSGDILTDAQYAAVGGNAVIMPPWSQQGRSVELTWGDEFTRFLGKQPALVAAIFGDSWGFMDLPAPVLFQGSQTLEVTLRRLFWPIVNADLGLDVPPIDTNWDFIFEGVALLPQGVDQSGSV
jgi:hypothetical protein